MAVEIGKLDEIHAIFGVRGSGKSTFMVMLSHELRTHYGGYFIGHSPGARLPTKLPDGKDSLISWHDSIKGMERGLQRTPERIHIMVDGDPEEVVEYGRAIAHATRKRAVEKAGFRFRDNRPVPPGVMAEPTFVLIDEGVLIDDAQKGNIRKVDKEWERFLTGARHEHVGLLWGIQRPTSKNWALTEQATQIHVFHYSHEWGLNSLRAAGVPREEIAKISSLPKYQHVTYNTWDLVKKDSPQ